MRRIVLIDDHPALRRGVKEIIQENFSDVIIDEADNEQMLYVMLKANKYDLLILDYSLPDKDGISLMNEVKSLQPNLHILIYSFYSENELGLKAMKLGASGFLSKSSAPDEIVNAIKVIFSGKKYISLKLANVLAENLVNGTNSNAIKKFSERELQVLKFLVDGRKLKDIAKELELSISTVSTFKNRVYKKAAVKSIPELYVFAIKNKIIEQHLM